MSRRSRRCPNTRTGHTGEMATMSSMSPYCRFVLWLQSHGMLHAIWNCIQSCQFLITSLLSSTNLCHFFIDMHLQKRILLRMWWILEVMRLSNVGRRTTDSHCHGEGSTSAGERVEGIIVFLEIGLRHFNKWSCKPPSSIIPIAIPSRPLPCGCSRRLPPKTWSRACLSAPMDTNTIGSESAVFKLLVHAQELYLRMQGLSSQSVFYGKCSFDATLIKGHS